MAGQGWESALNAAGNLINFTNVCGFPVLVDNAGHAPGTTVHIYAVVYSLSKPLWATTENGFTYTNFPIDNGIMYTNCLKFGIQVNDVMSAIADYSPASGAWLTFVKPHHPSAPDQIAGLSFQAAVYSVVRGAYSAVYTGVIDQSQKLDRVEQKVDWAVSSGSLLVMYADLPSDFQTASEVPGSGIVSTYQASQFGLGKYDVVNVLYSSLRPDSILSAMMIVAASANIASKATAIARTVEELVKTNEIAQKVESDPQAWFKLGSPFPDGFDAGSISAWDQHFAELNRICSTLHGKKIGNSDTPYNNPGFSPQIRQSVVGCIERFNIPKLKNLFKSLEDNRLGALKTYQSVMSTSTKPTEKAKQTTDLPGALKIANIKTFSNDALRRLASMQALKKQRLETKTSHAIEE